MKPIRSLATLLVIAALQGACKPAKPLDAETNAGSASEPAYLSVAAIADQATILGPTSPGVLSAPAPNLSAEHRIEHEKGDADFEEGFVLGPTSSITDKVGLGPVFNNTSCLNCHTKDGRGALPKIPETQTSVKLGPSESLLVRLSIEADGQPQPKDAAHGWGAPVPVPGFSGQLFHRGVWGLRPDSPGTGQADVLLSFDYTDFIYPDGRTVTLRKPKFKIQNAYDFNGATSRLDANDVRTSPRLAPPMVGLGLLEAIPSDQLLALADPNDSDGDGISGRPNWVLDIAKERAGDPLPFSLGRFGFKGSNPSLRQQTVGALNNDMGITSTWLPVQNIFNTPLFEAFKNLMGDAFAQMPVIEASDALVDSITVYSQTLGVPARRDVTHPQVRRGGQLFSEMKCATCHAGGYRIDGHVAIAEFRGQTVYPFTDLLLHDMGEGLADHRRDFDADGREWKTPALWGIGVTQLVNMNASFLHDGRAKTLEEAILWHGGEAQSSRDTFVALPADDRAAVIRFIKTL